MAHYLQRTKRLGARQLRQGAVSFRKGNQELHALRFLQLAPLGGPTHRLTKGALICRPVFVLIGDNNYVFLIPGVDTSTDL